MIASKLRPVKIFPTLYDIKPFIQQDHPKLHPDSPEYVEYYEDLEKKCIEGFWGEDKKGNKGGWRYMTPNLFFYINVGKIIDEDGIGGTEEISPMLRDVEWILSYDWHIARGFSGFEDDEEYSCNRILGKVEREEELANLEVILFEKAKHIRNSKGDLKKYVDPLKYLHQTHYKPLGRSVYENTATNTFTLGSRGFGKSWFGAEAVIGHEFIFYGKKYFDDNYIVDPSPTYILVGSSLEPKSAELLDKFNFLMEHLVENIGSYGRDETFSPGYFFRNTTGTLESGRFFKHKYKFKENGTWRTGGSGSELQHRVFTLNNPQGGVGGRFNVILVEEVGLCGNIITVHGANETTQVRRVKFGSSYYIGTGGNIKKIAGSKNIFLNPTHYDMLSYKDEFENRSKPICRFIPSTYVNNFFKDENGNTDVEASFQQEMSVREEKLKASTLDPYNEYVQSRPLTWSEMFLNSSTRYLPSAQAQERQLNLESTDEDLIKGAIGRLTYIDRDHTKVKFEVNNNLKPILELDIDPEKDLGGACIMYEPPPFPLPERTYVNSLYKVVYDPVQDDHGGSSLASVIVYKGYTMSASGDGIYDNIVFEWIGRYDSIDDMHEVALKAAIFYGCTCLPEVNISDIVRYARRKNKYHLLQPVPWEALAKALKNPTAKYDVGVRLSGPLDVQCELLLKQHLLLKRQKENDVINIEVLNSRRACAEIAVYDREINTDHVSSLKILALWLSQEESVINNTDEDREENLKELKKYVKAVSSSGKKNLMHEF